MRLLNIINFDIFSSQINFIQKEQFSCMNLYELRAYLEHLKIKFVIAGGGYKIA